MSTNSGSASAEGTRGYEEAITALNSLQTNAKALADQRKTGGRDLAKALSDVQAYAKRMELQDVELNGLRAIHVAGSKGKGSTSVMAATVMAGHGHKTGLYTSPHLIEARERIRINNTPISRESFAGYFWECWDLLHRNPSVDQGMTCMPTYFRFLTLMALKVFVAEKVDLAVVEVGLGGRYDATNIIRTPAVTGITSLGLEHTAILGNTLPEIAYQKAGIMKPAVPAYTVPQPPDAMATLVEVAVDVQTVLQATPPFSAYSTADVELGLAGVHQQANASLALQLCRAWNRQHGAVEGSAEVAETGPNSTLLVKGSPLGTAAADPITAVEAAALQAVSWPGRNQQVQQGAVRYLLDGAHTIDSCKAAAVWLDTVLAREEAAAAARPHRTLVFNCGGGRDPTPLLEPLANLCVQHQIEQAFFCPNFRTKGLSADQTNHTASNEEQLEAVAHCKERWEWLLAERGVHGSCKSLEFACLDSCMERVQALPANSAAGGQQDAPHTVLVTGSLHLVGGVLGILGMPVA